MVKRGYFVNTEDDVYGVAVVATSAKEAKKLAYHDDEFIDVDWTDLRVIWMRTANVEDLPIGIINDDMLALRHGVYSWIDGGVCDICHEDGHVELYNGQVVCPNCMENMEQAQALKVENDALKVLISKEKAELGLDTAS